MINFIVGVCAGVVLGMITMSMCAVQKDRPVSERLDKIRDAAVAAEKEGDTDKAKALWEAVWLFYDD